MNISDYVFNIGDEVITIDGIKGKIVEICDCDWCKERGFLEPIWDGEYCSDEYITIHQAERGFTNYYKIGNYKFNKLQKDLVESNIAYHEGELVRLRKQLAVIEELEKEETC